MAKGGKYLIVWAADEGSQLFARWGSEADYEEILATQTVVQGVSLFGAILSDVNYAALCKITRDHDFTLGGSRETRKS